MDRHLVVAEVSPELWARWGPLWTWLLLAGHFWSEGKKPMGLPTEAPAL